MKHIPFILSILLLITPLVGQSKETGVLYRWENGSKYMGEWKNGKKHGQGTFTYGKGKWKGEKYVGEFKHEYRTLCKKYVQSEIKVREFPTRHLNKPISKLLLIISTFYKMSFSASTNLPV